MHGMNVRERKNHLPIPNRKIIVRLAVAQFSNVLSVVQPWLVKIILLLILLPNPQVFLQMRIQFFLPRILLIVGNRQSWFDLFQTKIQIILIFLKKTIMKKVIMSIAIIVLSAGAVVATTVGATKSSTECKSCKHCTCPTCTDECCGCCK